MPDSERQETLSQLVVREAIDRGMESPMRETIVEAVEEAEGSGSRARTIPLAGLLVGAGAAVGYALGLRSGEESGGLPIDEVDAPEGVSEVLEEAEVGPDGGDEADDSGGGLRRIALVAAAAIAGVAIARRLRSGGEEWEPIDEFESAVDADETEGESESIEVGETDEEAEGADESEEGDERSEDAQAGEEIEE